MKPGTKVQVRAYPDQYLDRVVVQITENKVFICKKEEYEEAAKHSRNPDCIGFPVGDVKLIV